MLSPVPPALGNRVERSTEHVVDGCFQSLRRIAAAVGRSVDMPLHVDVIRRRCAIVAGSRAPNCSHAIVEAALCT